ncbi:MAG: hypothetical protein JW708_11195, partial [Vallitaleaceae bacterium]|nr:hypothetical protein [Vallitaleaceae bacterium]
IAKKEKQSKDLRQWIYWISIGSLVIILFLLFRRRKKQRRDFSKELYRYYRLILMYFRVYRLEKRNDETIREYAKRIETSYLLEAKEFTNYVERFEVAFYDESLVTEEELQDLRHYKNRIRKNARRTVSVFGYIQLLIFESINRYR